jgi:translation elongation factor EF-G
MAVERERGISVSSAVMSFEHEVGGLTKSTTIFWYNVHMPDVRALIVAPSRSGAN